MFEVEAVDQGFMGKRARLRALGDALVPANDIVSAEDGPWANHLRAPFAAGQVVTVTLPANLDLQVGQTLAIAG